MSPIFLTHSDIVFLKTILLTKGSHFKVDDNCVSVLTQVVLYPKYLCWYTNSKGTFVYFTDEFMQEIC